MRESSHPKTRVKFHPANKGEVQKYINKLDNKLAAAVIAVLKDIEHHGIAVDDGIGYKTKKIDSQLWEIKIKNQRFIYVYSDQGEITILVAFKKETRKTPVRTIALASRRARSLP